MIYTRSATSRHRDTYYNGIHRDTLLKVEVQLKPAVTEANKK